VTSPLSQIIWAPIAFCQFSVAGYGNSLRAFGSFISLEPQGTGGPVKLNFEGFLLAIHSFIAAPCASKIALRRAFFHYYRYLHIVHIKTDAA
jgi:hypothetical protein